MANLASSAEMKIFVIAKTAAKERKIKRVDKQHLAVWVKERPQKGKANKAIEKAVADYLGIPKSCVSILHGKTSKRKVLEVE